MADVAAGPKPSATGLTWDVAHVADVAAPLASNGNGWRYDQPLVPCAACGTGTTNRAPSGQPLHLACDTRTTQKAPTMAEIDGRADARSPVTCIRREGPQPPSGHAQTRRPHGSSRWSAAHGRRTADCHIRSQPAWPASQRPRPTTGSARSADRKRE